MLYHIKLQLLEVYGLGCDYEQKFDGVGTRLLNNTSTAMFLHLLRKGNN